MLHNEKWKETEIFELHKQELIIHENYNMYKLHY